MPSPTEELGQLLQNPATTPNFKQLAMALVRQGADVTVCAASGSYSTVLDVLARTNKAAVNNNELIELVRLNPAVLERKDKYNRTALQSLMDALHYEECSFDDFKQSAMILAREKADVTVCSSKGVHYTLLHILVLNNKAGANNNEIIELITLNPAVLAGKDKNGRTALQSLMDVFENNACSLDDFKQTAMILARKKADISVRSTADGDTLLHILVLNNMNGINNDDIVELVTLNPAVLTFKSKYNKTALQSLLDDFNYSTYSFYRKSSFYNKLSFEELKQSAMVLAKLGANRSQKETGIKGDTLLHVLVLNHLNENMSEIKALIDLNDQVVNFRNESGCTPIHVLLTNNPSLTVDMIDTLLSTTNLNLKDNEGATLLHAACDAGNLPAVKHLCSKGLSLTALTNRKKTLIHSAVSSGNEDLVQWLIDTQKIDINARNEQGATALCFARGKIAKLLLEATIKTLPVKKAIKFLADRYEGRESPFINSRKQLCYSIRAMHDYGKLLKNHDNSKSQVAIELADKLGAMVMALLNQKPEQRNFAEFKTQFLVLLHSRDQEMSAYRMSWATIVVNIAIALTGIGLLIIAGKLIHSKVTEGRTLFFFQDNKTTCEIKINTIEKAADELVLSAQTI